MRARIRKLISRVLQVLLGRRRAAESMFACGWIGRNEYYDWLTYEIMERCIPRNGVCVDVGCHSGSMLTVMMRQAPAGRHFAFEPLPDYYAGLVREFSGPNVSIFNAALSNQEGVTTFKHDVTRPAFSGLQERSYEGGNDVICEISVETRMLDRVITEAGVDRLDFVKIDVEGAERLVLEGARESIVRFKPAVVFECGLGGADYYGTRPEQIFDLFVDGGLKISLLADFLNHREALSRNDFCDQFNEGRNYFFIAHR